MSILDTVDPDFVWHKPKSGDPDGEIIEEKLYREATVESMLAETRKQVLMEIRSHAAQLITRNDIIERIDAILYEVKLAAAWQSQRKERSDE